MNDKLSDIIPTAGLLLAIVTALMSFWYAEVSAAIHESEPTLPAEKELVRNKIAPVFWSKAIPLVIGSIMVAAIFLPRSLAIVIEALQAWHTRARYDDMKTALVATEVLMIALAGFTSILAWRLGRKHRRLR